MKLKITILMILGALALGAAETELHDIKAAIQNNSAAWQVGESWVTELSHAEFAQLCGTLLEPTADAPERLLSLAQVDELPSQLDWRDHNGNWVTPVRNQKSCGSCWDFSATAQVEAWWQIFNEDPTTDIDLSEQFVLSCAGAGSCAGGSVEAALSFYQTSGVPLETCLPYGATDDIGCDEVCADWQDNAVAIPGWGYVTLEEAIVDNIKQALYRHPVSATYTVFEDFSYYAGGVYEHVWGDVSGGHAILLVGWNDDEQSWICKNSWGANWGEEGYFRIKWGDSGMGKNIPFVYDQLTESALQLTPTAIDLTLAPGDSATRIIQVSNAGSGQLQFSLIDYEVPLVFHPDVFNAFDDASWWCGDPTIGGYQNHWLQYLDTPEIDLSSAADPKLTFQMFWEIETPAGATPPWDGWDGANVWISQDAGETFTVLEPTEPRYTCQSLWAFGDATQGWNMGTNIAGWAGSSDGWMPAVFDPAKFKSQHVVIRFAFASDMGFCTDDDENVTGFFVDDIHVADGADTLFFDSADNVKTMQRHGFGIKTASWIKIDTPGALLSPGEVHEAMITVSTRGLAAGEYQGLISVSSNDTTALMDVPIHLTVAAPEYDLAVTTINGAEAVRVLSEFTPATTIHNAGLYDAADFDVVCEMQRADTVFYSENFHVDLLRADESMDITFKPIVPIDTTDITLSVFIDNYSQDLVSFNNGLDAQIRMTNVVDDFEKENTAWAAHGGWGVTNKYQGHESEYAAHVNGGSIPYKANMDATFLFTPAFSIAHADSIVLSYWAWTFTEEGQDNCCLQVSTDSLTWVTVDTVSGQDPTFKERHVLISPFIDENAEKLWFRYHFKSNDSEQFIGVLIDDIKIAAIEKADFPSIVTSESFSPKEWQLSQNYPNPFNPSTTIHYYISKPAHVQISIFSLTGRVVDRLFDGVQEGGSFSVTWTPHDLATGVYIYKIEAYTETGERFRALKKMLFIK